MNLHDSGVSIFFYLFIFLLKSFKMMRMLSGPQFNLASKRHNEK